MAERAQYSASTGLHTAPPGTFSSSSDPGLHSCTSVRLLYYEHQIVNNMTFEQTEMCLSLTTKWIHVFIHLYTTRLE